MAVDKVDTNSGKRRVCLRGLQLDLVSAWEPFLRFVYRDYREAADYRRERRLGRGGSLTGRRPRVGVTPGAGRDGISPGIYRRGEEAWDVPICSDWHGETSAAWN